MTTEASQPSPAAAPADGRDAGTLSPWALIRIRFARHRIACLSAGFLVCLYIAAVGTPWIAPHASNDRHLDRIFAPPQPIHFSWDTGLYTHPLVGEQNPLDRSWAYTVDESVRIPLGWFVPRSDEQADMPGWMLFGPESPEIAPGEASYLHILGTDRYGRDIFTRLLYGSQISLTIGLVAIAVTFVLGLAIGGISGYVGGTVDNVIQRFIEVVNAFPQLPLWFAVAAILPRDWSSLQVYFAITLLLASLNWTGLARVVRGKILALREEDYVMAARLLGASPRRIIALHLIPGFSSHIIVVLTLGIPGMILGETALSFLGLGLQPPIVSWGVMLQDCLAIDVVLIYPWLLAPMVAIIATVLAFNFVGDGLRDAADPYS